MGRLIKIVVFLAVIVIGIVLAVQYTQDSAKPDAETQQQQQADKEGGIQPQEKYGFAPIGGDE